MHEREENTGQKYDNGNSHHTLFIQRNDPGQQYARIGIAQYGYTYHRQQIGGK